MACTGADKEYQPQSWMHGSQVYMSRTKAEVSPEVMSSGSHWEFFAGNDGVSRHDIAGIWVAFFSIYIVAAGQGEVGG